MIIRRKNWDNQFYETVIKNENKKKITKQQQQLTTEMKLRSF